VDFSGTEFARSDAAGASPDKPGMLMGNRWSLRYEDMAKMLEELLAHYGYYDTATVMTQGDDVAEEGGRR